jgi:hypothetical protein
MAVVVVVLEEDEQGKAVQRSNFCAAQVNTNGKLAVRLSSQEGWPLI